MTEPTASEAPTMKHAKRAGAQRATLACLIAALCACGNDDAAVGGLPGPGDSPRGEDGGGPGIAPTDAGGPRCLPGSAPGRAEACDGDDDDCDGLIDEDFDLTTDPDHCGACGRSCARDNAEVACVEAVCVITGCAPGTVDADGAAENGCEARCAVVPGDEICDGADNDCDGLVDENVDTVTDPAHCGGCGRACAYDQGVAGCAAGECALLGCEPGFGDFDGDAANGCEAECTPEFAGVEQCDGEDNDCDGTIDEDFDLESDGEHCGGCGQRCGFANAGAQCVDSLCRLAACDPGFIDADGIADNGCETRCVPSNDRIETCDGVDNDCNGVVDDGFDLETDPENCGGCGQMDETFICRLPNAEVTCLAGACAIDRCEPGFADIDEVPANGCEAACETSNGGVETCDGIDNDCDGISDEDYDFATDPAHCGACNRACETGNAVAGCARGRCLIAECPPGRVDLDREIANGCEYVCTPSVPSDEVCDLVDNDCDGTVDEGFDTRFDLDHCGACNRRCNPRHAVAACNQTHCEVTRCEDGWVDANDDPTDGCELECTSSAGGIELCDLDDNDCDGFIDEGFDTDSDIDHCGACNRTCALINGRTTCLVGACIPAGCLAGWIDADGELENGCEYRCTPTVPAAEICDGLDNDCDGTIDNGFDFGSVDHCGQCDVSCRFDRATSTCDEGVCRLLECDAGFVDANRNPLDGCELECTPDDDPAELCDEVDNDCDGAVDETFDLRNDADHCGGCDVICGFERARAFCNGGECDILACEPGFVDLDRERENGCECALTNGGVERCDDVDNDCNGVVDDLDQLVPPADIECLSRGICFGVEPTCAHSEWRCVYPDDWQPEETRCDGLDNDCDGTRDEGFVGLGTPCSDGIGICRATGEIVCNADRDDVQCSVTAMPERAVAETCNGLDDDCDGVTDEDSDVLVTVPAGNGVAAFTIYAFEATRTDAEIDDAGTSFARACSRAGVLPWTNVAYDTALTACEAAGLTLCDGAQWLRACEGDFGQTYPYGDQFDAQRCNGQAYDADPHRAGDQDEPVPTGEPDRCVRNWPNGLLFDLSGNVWEWTTEAVGGGGAARALRGGSYGNISGGMTCQFANAAQADAARENIGFRCCGLPD